jgi:hypothetical protein
MEKKVRFLFFNQFSLGVMIMQNSRARLPSLDKKIHSKNRTMVLEPRDLIGQFIPQEITTSMNIGEDMW